MARALEVLKLPDAALPAGKRGAAADKEEDSVIRPDFGGRPRPDLPASANEEVSLPLYGRIAAGTPIEALRDPSSFVGVPPSMLGKGDYYALEVSGAAEA